MLKKLLQSTPIFNNSRIMIRLVAGVLIFAHGLGVFNHGHMEGNIAWLTDLYFPAPVFMAYLGKGAEFAGGILIVLGLLTRLAAITLVINMAVITFVLGSGKLLTDDELPFLLMMLFVYLFFTGAGKWSIDRLLFDEKAKQ